MAASIWGGGGVNVRTDVNACDFPGGRHKMLPQGCTDTVRKPALKVDCRRYIPRRTGTRARVSIAPGFLVGCSTN